MTLFDRTMERAEGMSHAERASAYLYYWNRHQHRAISLVGAAFFFGFGLFVGLIL